jgi:hypothetical protein
MKTRNEAEDMRKLPKGHKSVYDPTFKYTSASRTDIAKTFARIKREQRANKEEVEEKVLKLKRQ